MLLGNEFAKLKISNGRVGLENPQNEDFHWPKSPRTYNAQTWVFTTPWKTGEEFDLNDFIVERDLTFIIFLWFIKESDFDITYKG